MNIREIRKICPYLPTARIKDEIACNHNGYKSDRGMLSYLKSLNEKYEKKATQGNVSSLTIKISWKRSKQWGMNPHASILWTDDSGSHFIEDFTTAGGCGYDKESTVIAQCFNHVCSGMLYRKRNSKKAIPYGILMNKDFGIPRFEGGVGANCYYDIAEFLGGKFEHTAWSDTFDQYVFTHK